MAKSVFEGEWTGLPECFVSKDGSTYHNSKSVIINYLVHEEVPPIPETAGLVVDLSLIMRSQASVVNTVSSFNDLYESIITNIVGTAKTIGAQRIDIVSHLYSETSIKHSTWVGRKKAAGTRFIPR